MLEKNLEEIYENYADFVYRYIFLLVHNKEVAEDLTQETFLKAFRSFHQFNGQANISTWIIKIAKNTTYDYFRQQKWRSIFSLESDIHPSIFSPSSEEEVIKQSEIEALYEALKKLKKEYQQVLILRKINEFSTKETAEVLGWTTHKVKAKLARAIKKLNEEMARQEVGNFGQSKQV